MNKYQQIDFFTILLQTGKNKYFKFFLFFKSNTFLIRIVFINSKKNQQIFFLSKLSFLFCYKIYLITFDCFGNFITVNSNKMKKISLKQDANNFNFKIKNSFLFENLKIFFLVYLCSGLINSNLLIFN